MNTPAGWYQDPYAPGVRWWDGMQWTAYTASPPPAAGPVTDRPERGRLWGPGFLVLFIVCGVLTALSVLVTLPWSVVAVAAAAPTTAAVVATFIWVDRFEPEPWSARLWAFAWGGLVAATFAGLVNEIGAVAFGESSPLVFSGTAPIGEELLKLAGVLILVKLKKIDGPLDAIVLAGLVAAGFAFTENIQYYATGFSSGPEVAVATLVMRGVFTPFAHPLFTGISAGFVGLAVRRRQPVIGVFGVLLAMTCHGVWNATTGSAPLLHALIMVPLFFVCVGAVLMFRSRELRSIKRAPELFGALIAPAEAPLLWDSGYRKRVKAFLPEPARRALETWRTTAARLVLIYSRADAAQHQERLDALAASLQESAAVWRAALPAPLG